MCLLLQTTASLCCSKTEDVWILLVRRKHPSAGVLAGRRSFFKALNRLIYGAWSLNGPFTDGSLEHS